DEGESGNEGDAEGPKPSRLLPTLHSSIFSNSLKTLNRMSHAKRVCFNLGASWHWLALYVDRRHQT
ncbi:MAG: hypothetical protein ACLP4V_29535, partial [Methylocella sp.]